MFDIFPAIDILDGRCVRLMRGDYEAKTEYGWNPVEIAERWMSQGARWLHVVDLGAAKSGQPENTRVIAQLVHRASQRGVRVQVGGGIRSSETLATWLGLGVARCIVGTAARNLDWVNEVVAQFGREALVVGLDGRDGLLAVHGWTDQTDVPLVALAEKLAKVGVKHALVTDVERDGTLEGANLELALSIQQAGLQAIASGGVRNLEDVLAAKRAGLAGVIAGRSIYEGTLSLTDAVQVLMPNTGASASTSPQTPPATVCESTATVCDSTARVAESNAAAGEPKGGF